MTQVQWASDLLKSDFNPEQIINLTPVAKFGINKILDLNILCYRINTLVKGKWQTQTNILIRPKLGYSAWLGIFIVSSVTLSLYFCLSPLSLPTLI
jgi:hypothetical protein